MEAPVFEKTFTELLPFELSAKDPDALQGAAVPIVMTPNQPAKCSSPAASDRVAGAGTPLDFSDIFDSDCEESPGVCSYTLLPISSFKF